MTTQSRNQREGKMQGKKTGSYIRGFFPIDGFAFYMTTRKARKAYKMSIEGRFFREADK